MAAGTPFSQAPGIPLRQKVRPSMPSSSAQTADQSQEWFPPRQNEDLNDHNRAALKALVTHPDQSRRLRPAPKDQNSAADHRHRCPHRQNSGRKPRLACAKCAVQNAGKRIAWVESDQSVLPEMQVCTGFDIGAKAKPRDLTGVLRHLQLQPPYAVGPRGVTRRPGRACPPRRGKRPRL